MHKLHALKSTPDYPLPHVTSKSEKNKPSGKQHQDENDNTKTAHHEQHADGTNTTYIAHNKAPLKLTHGDLGANFLALETSAA